MNLAIKLKDVTKTFGKTTALYGISLDIREGEIFGLLGPNGAGKTTLVRIIGGQIHPNRGSYVEVLGNRRRISKKNIGVVSQEITLYKYLSIEENLEFLAKIYDVPSSDVQSQIDELLGLAQLTEQRKKRVDTLSGGMKRRLNVIASLIHDPILLILDEPTVGIDPQTRQAIWEMIFRLRDEGKTVLLTTHMMEEAEFLSDRIGILDQGQLIALGTSHELKKQINLDKIISLIFDTETTLADQLILQFQDRSYSRIIDSGHKTRFSFSSSDHSLDMVEIERIQENSKKEIDSIQIREVSLQDVFVTLTGRDLRE